MNYINVDIVKRKIVSTYGILNSSKYGKFKIAPVYFIKAYARVVSGKELDSKDNKFKYDITSEYISVKDFGILITILNEKTQH